MLPVLLMVTVCIVVLGSMIKNAITVQTITPAEIRLDYMSNYNHQKQFAENCSTSDYGVSCKSLFNVLEAFNGREAIVRQMFDDNIALQNLVKKSVADNQVCREDSSYPVPVDCVAISRWLSNQSGDKELIEKNSLQSYEIQDWYKYYLIESQAKSIVKTAEVLK